MNSTRCILLSLCFFLIGVLLITPYAHGELPFNDDFEDGDLVGWTIGGRQNGTGHVDVVDRHGSKMGHVFHQAFTEITLEKTFSFNPSGADQLNTATFDRLEAAIFSFWPNS